MDTCNSKWDAILDFVNQTLHFSVTYNHHLFGCRFGEIVLMITQAQYQFGDHALQRVMFLVVVWLYPVSMSQNQMLSTAWLNQLQKRPHLKNSRSGLHQTRIHGHVAFIKYVVRLFILWPYVSSKKKHPGSL